MFTRSNNHTNNAHPVPTDMAAEIPQAPKPQPPKLPAAKKKTVPAQQPPHVSIISNDLTILGKDLKIISKGSIRVDGEIQGEIRGVDVTVGAKGKVIGIVAARSVIVDGQVQGEIQAKTVALHSNSHVDGDVHHQSLSMDKGAVFDGRSKRHEDNGDLEPQLNLNAGDASAKTPPEGDSTTPH